MDEEIAKLVAAVFHGWQQGKEDLDPQAQYLLQRRHSEFLRNGLGIQDKEDRTRYMDFMSELQSVLSLARKTLSGGAEDGIWFARDDLVGVPLSVLQSMTSRLDEGKLDEELLCTFRKGHYVPVMRQCTRARSRRKLYSAKENRFKENVDRLERILCLRHEIAKLLGFNNHAELKMEEKMSNSVEDITNQLHDWTQQLQPVAHLEIQRMLELKRAYLTTKLLDACDDDDPEKLYFWDWSFYSSLLKKQEYSVDVSRISEYFEVMHTVENMLLIFNELFSIYFEKTEGSVWQKDVITYTVWSNKTPTHECDFLGYLYLDLFARAGKYEGAHHAMIQPSYTNDTGLRHYAADALICSVLRATEGPTLLMMNEVRTIFHELGHCIHFLVSKARYGLYPSRDFIEIPSIVLENWIWTPEVLKRLGRHYSYLNKDFNSLWKVRAGSQHDAEERLSNKLIGDLVRTKTINMAHDMLTQLHLAIFDVSIHTPSASTNNATDKVNVTTLWNRLKGKIIGLEGDEEALGIGQAGFPHIFRKYDAGYFAYPLSKVWATDIFSTAFQSDPMNPSMGQRYRELVLKPGAGVAEADTLKQFLGREPNSQAFFGELLLSAGRN
ncbi:zincin [Cadophora sp. DSE1049]|nr:zincin [Cadophora sp. DSE1049]